MLISALCLPTLRSTCTCSFQQDNNLISHWSSSRRAKLEGRNLFFLTCISLCMWLQLHLAACTFQRLALICSRHPAFIYRKHLESWNQRRLFLQGLCQLRTFPFYGLMLIGKKLGAASLSVIYESQERCLLRGLSEHLFFLWGLYAEV